MSTRNSFFAKNDYPSMNTSDNKDCRLFNVNLNQGPKCSNYSPVTINGNAGKKFNNKLTTDNDTKRFAFSSIIAAAPSCLTFLIDSSQVEDDDLSKRWTTNGKYNGSNLSLHISAFENSNDIVTGPIRSSSLMFGFGNEKMTILNPFEFPRQQKEESLKEPELTNFKASQKLLNPNQEQSQKFTMMRSDRRMTRILEGTRDKRQINHRFSDELPYVPSLDGKTPPLQGAHGTYTFERELGHGSQGSVCQVRDQNGLLHALKLGNIETMDTEIEILLQAEQRGFSNLCHHIDNGYFEYEFTEEKIVKFRFVVMDLLGKNVEEITKEFGKFSKGAALLLAKQALRALEQLHQIGYIHRDLMPSNFAIGLKEEANIEGESGLQMKVQSENEVASFHTLYLIDMGLCQNPFVTNVDSNSVGNRAFASLAKHDLKELVFKDDTESVLYIFLEWFGIAKFTGTAQLEQKKKEIMLQKKCNGIDLPQPIQQYIDHLNATPIGKKVDYRFLRDLFNKLYEKSEVDLRLPWDPAFMYHGPDHEKVPHINPPYFLKHLYNDKMNVTLYYQDGSFKLRSDIHALAILKIFSCSNKKCSARLYVQSNIEAIRNYEVALIVGKERDHDPEKCQKSQMPELTLMTLNGAKEFEKTLS